ncbi:MAG: hypothetical protein WAN02_06975, partial [Mycobacterium sp.]
MQIYAFWPMVLRSRPRIVDLVEPEEATVTVDIIGTNKPTVIDADLPPIAYEHAANPEEAHRLIRQARLQGPIALGPHGPEVLS